MRRHYLSTPRSLMTKKKYYIHFNILCKFYISLYHSYTSLALSQCTEFEDKNKSIDISLMTSLVGAGKLEHPFRVSRC